MGFWWLWWQHLSSIWLLSIHQVQCIVKTIFSCQSLLSWCIFHIFICTRYFSGWKRGWSYSILSQKMVCKNNRWFHFHICLLICDFPIVSSRIPHIFVFWCWIFINNICGIHVFFHAILCSFRRIALWMCWRQKLKWYFQFDLT